MASNLWTCAKCTYQNNSDRTHCRICSAKQPRKRSIDELNISHKSNPKKRKICTNMPNVDIDMEDTKYDDEMELFYFPPSPKRNNKNKKITIDNIDVFSCDNTIKLDRAQKNNKQPHIINEVQIDENNYSSTNSLSNLSNDQFHYYTGEEIDALDFDINNYDISKLLKLEKKFFEWKQIHKGCVLCIQNGYKYEFYADDAIIVSMVLGAQISNKVGVLSKVYLPEFRLNVYLRRLVDVGLMIAVFDQTQTTSTKQEKMSIIHRELSGIHTKGTFVTCHNESFDSNKFVLSFHEIPIDATFDDAKKVQINLILLDLFVGNLYFDSFEDDALRCNFLSILSHFNIVEIILPRNELSDITHKILQNKYSKLCTKNAVRWTRVRLADFGYSECIALMMDIFKNKASDKWMAKLLKCDESILISFSFLVSYLHKFKLAHTLIHCQMKCLNDAMFMQLAGSTCSHLEIFENMNGGKECTLFELMSMHNLTPFGCRLMHRWISQPLFDANAIVLRQSAVKYLTKNVHIFEDLIGALSTCKDLEKRLRAIQCLRCSPMRFVDALNEFDKILKVIPMECGLLESLFSTVNRQKLRQIIDRYQCKLNVDMNGYENAMNDMSNYPKMIQCFEQIKAAKQTLNKLLDSIRKKLKNPHLEYKDVGSDYYLIEIGKNEQSEYDIPSDWKLISQTKRFYRYQSIEICEAAKILAIENEQFLYEAKKAWTDFLCDFNAHSFDFQTFIDVLSQFDCLHSLSVLATNSKYAMPQIMDDSDGKILQIMQGRHPSLEEHLAQKGVDFIPNDIALNQATSQMIITGPNMNGKSVYIKMIGLLIIMAQIGSFVPVQNMKLSPFDYIGTRLGIYDCINDGKSTFFVEMSECAHLIANATNKSFLILDEIGRGTSTFDGISMAYSILKYIAESAQCMALFVTHYTELLELGYEKDGCIANYFMSFEENKDGIEYLYKMKEGECRQSYGIQVAKLSGIPDKIIKKAQQYSNNMKEIALNGFEEKIKQFEAVLNELNI